ncbi:MULTISPECIES: DM13 domain-containing protein [Streptomyces]|uniref:DM13 domain-containing protein n=1 Tax=Streptomyces TaxID=1883 RepID=UPI0029CB0918|nr:DM13 domain-containing protein [Streptomyces sp. F8]MDX6760123.1 DM13 domain-containing protein [Streptomyces sp. F8]
MAAVTLAGVGLYWFQPWKLWTDEKVSEALPSTSALPAAPTASPSAGTSNGPDLRVWLTDAPVKEGKEGWHVFDDGKYVSLGKLKGNKGDQNYPIPADVQLADYTSVTIWCDRFDVSFGAAELA